MKTVMLTVEVETDATVPQTVKWFRDIGQFQIEGKVGHREAKILQVTGQKPGNRSGGKKKGK